jgi:hypothetical protein
MQFLDKLGWPVEKFENRPILNFIRLLIHTRKIKRGKFKHGYTDSESNDFQAPKIPTLDAPDNQ